MANRMTFTKIGELFMPKIRLPLADTKDLIIRPCVVSIVEELNLIMGFDKGIKISYPDESGQLAQLNSLMGGTRDTGDGSSFSADQLISITVDEQFEESYTATPVMKPEGMPIWRDDALGVILRPIHMPAILKISFKYRCYDRTQAEAWRNRMRSKISIWGDVNYHILDYSYIVPKEFLYVMKEIYTLRENIAGYGDSWGQYFDSHRGPRFTTISNLKGNKTELAVSEKQTRVLGGFDFNTDMERGEKDGDNSSWTVSFNYEVWYSRPTEMQLEYPLFVHQQLLPDACIPKVSDTSSMTPYGSDRHFNKSDWLLESYSAINEKEKAYRYHGIRVPEFDEYVVEQNIPYTRSIYLAYLQLDSPDPGALIKITDIPNVFLSDELKEFLKKEIKYLTIPGESVFHLTLYSYHGPKSFDSIYVDNELMVYTKNALNLRDEYRLRFSIVYDWSTLTEDALKRFSKYPNLVKDLFIYLGNDWNLLIQYILSLHKPYYDTTTTNTKRYTTTTDKHNNPIVTKEKSEFTMFEKWTIIPWWIMLIIVKFIKGDLTETPMARTVQTQFIKTHQLEEYHGSISYHKT